jgi:SAM-dependent methyltransferase
MNAASTHLGPMPPDELMIRIGVDPHSLKTLAQRQSFFDETGRDAVRDIVSALPEGWEWENKAVLDFGCGSGRVLRHMLPYGRSGTTFAGCDVHADTVAWMRENYPESVRFDVSGDAPLPYEDGSFDLIYAASVFTHIPDWAPWVREMHRLLRPGGTLVASLHGRGFWSVGIAGGRGVEWDEDGTGIIVELYGSGFDDSWGPAVYVSEWWLREHWGRALEIARFEPKGFALEESADHGQAWVVARKHRDTVPSVAELQEPRDDPREARAAVRAQWLAYDERDPSQTHIVHVEVPVRDPQTDELRRRYETIVNSHSWKLTAPLRALGRRIRR